MKVHKVHARQKALAMLIRGPDAWNAWRDANQHESLDLREVVMADHRVTFRGYIMKKVNFDHADFRGCDLSYSHWMKCNLTSANFKNVNGSGSMMLMCNCRKATFGGYFPPWSWSVWRECKLNEAIFDGFTFDAMLLMGCEFTGADLREADFWSCDHIHNCTWPDTDLIVHVPKIGGHGMFVHLQRDRTSVGCTTMSNTQWLELTEKEFQTVTLDRPSLEYWKKARVRLAKLAERLEPYPDCIGDQLMRRVTLELQKKSEEAGPKRPNLVTMNYSLL